MGEKKKRLFRPYYVLVGPGGRQSLVKGLGDLHSKPQTLVLVVEVGLRVEVCHPL